jgi:hypothetical protein
MSFESSKRGDAALGFALLLGVVCGAASFLASAVATLSIAVRTGLLQLHLFEYRPPPSFKESAVVHGSIALSCSIVILVLCLTCRLVMRLARPHEGGS